MSVHVSRPAGVVQGGAARRSVVRAGVWCVCLHLNLRGGSAPQAVCRGPSQETGRDAQTSYGPQDFPNSYKLLASLTSHPLVMNAGVTHMDVGRRGRQE